MSDPTEAEVLADTQRWLQRAVIGLNLCPFAKAVVARQQLRCVVSDARDVQALAQALGAEMLQLAAADPAQTDTTLLIHPRVLGDFDDYNEFLGLADALLHELRLQGVLQLASFHPQYRFADADEDDVANCSNRSPYPMLHLLREDSVERALATHPDAASIYERNIDTLRRLGWEGWYTLNRA